MESILTISQKEVNILKVNIETNDDKLTVEETSEVLAIRTRQKYRILKQVKKEGSKGIIHLFERKEIKPWIP
ncbi:MAG: hypothetical protein ACOYU5_02295 [Stygiobacter sp.]